MAEHVLRDEEKFFKLRSGRGLRSLRELADALPSMPQDEFSYHLGPPRHDFSKWVGEALGEPELAERLRACKSRAEFQTLLYNHVTQADLGMRKATRGPRSPEEERIASDGEAFAAYHEEDAKKKDALADRFDAVARRMAAGMTEETPHEVEEKAERLAGRYHEIRQRISEARKAGKDPLIAELTIRPVPPKLDYARISRDDKDFQQIAAIMDEGEQELAEALAHEEPDARREVAALVGDAGKAGDGKPPAASASAQDTNAADAGKADASGAPGAAPGAGPAETDGGETDGGGS